MTVRVLEKPPGSGRYYVILAVEGGSTFFGASRSPIGDDFGEFRDGLTGKYGPLPGRDPCSHYFLGFAAVPGA